MVAATLSIHENFHVETYGKGGKTPWLNYLVLSVVANVLIVSAVNITAIQKQQTEPMAMKIHLKALAAPMQRNLDISQNQKKVQKTMPSVETHKSGKKSYVSKPRVRNRDAMTPTKVQSVKQNAKSLSQAKHSLQKAVLPSVSLDQNRGKEKQTVIHQANYRYQTAPEYPKRALELGQQGIVMLHAKVLPNGKTEALKIAHSSGHRLLDIAAVNAVKKWLFEPSKKDGHIITSWVRVPVRFVIQ